ncbi:MAG: CpsD/CapB family tyrosine-protein kinase [candidate division KSB1 bacterium]|nr:CpsD/CapB family tyrosine-protein kinase [candidate division KSB1 bacterium]MDZ7276135.1 CpsD/CapB family tyrosine-protein kinase [candidate division KSB1 bacterium]MDZ7287085.1 CpsD/CapB family tyrosine-protein kinase [candidate division KSB1 bacterium]MDZ7296990.1 CpsD/CapB family tyrosine-protein kinase [candidate division KSB1 bacterium]MDZ7306180.1 CpsD/CapB family tyrosine-protein kinase [candidate division KSB1 bacterium]
MDSALTLPDDLRNSETLPASDLQRLALPATETGVGSPTIGRLLPRLSKEQLKLRNILLLAREQRGIRSVLLTGADEGAGVTAVAVSLALGLSLDPQKEILLVDANVRRPQLHRLLPLTMSEGLKSAAAGSGSFLEMAVVTGLPNLHVMPAIGGRYGTSFEARRFAAVAAALHETFDFVILDAPAFDSTPEVAMLSAYVQSVILVAEAGRTCVPEVREIIRELSRVKATLLGIVLNREREQLPALLRQ